jgi:hypothetical protein
MVELKAYEYRPGNTDEDMHMEKINNINDKQINYLKNKIYLDNNKNDKKNMNGNEFMNLTIGKIYDNIINLLPNLYNDYHKKYLEVSLDLKSKDDFTSENIIIKETLISFLLSSKNIIYVGIIIIFISFLLYIIN